MRKVRIFEVLKLFKEIGTKIRLEDWQSKDIGSNFVN